MIKSITQDYKRLIRDTSIDANTLEECALHYLTASCQADFARDSGISDILTRWVESQVDNVEGTWWISIPHYLPCKILVREYDPPYSDILSALADWYGAGIAPVFSTKVTGGSPLWSDSTNDLFRAVHDSHHWLYQLRDDVISEVKLGHLTAKAVYNWALNENICGELAEIAANTMFFGVAGQATASTWLGGFDGKRRNPYTGEVLSFSQKVILSRHYNPATLHGGKS